MSALGDLLELMHGATARVRSVHATLEERSRHALLERAYLRFAEDVGTAPGGGYFVVPGGDGETVDENVQRVELWAEPGRFRQTHGGTDADHVLVVDGGRWWSWSPAFGLHSSDQQRGVTHSGGLASLDPSFLLAGTTLEPADSAVVAGRQTRGVRVHRLSRDLAPPYGFWPGVEDALVWLDAERGLVLRHAELVDGEEAFVREVQEIEYDGPVPPGTFLFELPAGESGRARAEPQMTTVDNAVALASFRVFKLARIPDGWRVHAIYTPAMDRPPEPDSVTLLYMRADGGERLHIRERTRAHELPTAGGERRFEHGGRSYIALGPERPAGRQAAELIFASEGTNLRLSSSELSLEQLLERAEQLVPA